MTHLVDLLLHADRYLLDIVATYGRWIYGILFLIVFAETGLVVTPFLPGDSLLFAAGAIAATGALDITTRGYCCWSPPSAGRGQLLRRTGDRCTGHREVEERPALGPLDQPGLHRARPRIFARHGGKAVVLARFTPIVRTFIPFVAGAAKWPIRPSRSTTSPAAWRG
jgi:membrane-associated protein